MDWDEIAIYNHTFIVFKHELHCLYHIASPCRLIQAGEDA